MLGVEVAEARVHVALLVGGGQQAREAHERLLGRVPVALLDAQLGEGRERADVVGLLGERRLEGAARAGRVARVEQDAPPPHLHREALARVGDALDAPLEQRRERSGCISPHGVEVREAIEDVLVGDVDRGGRVERDERAVLVLRLVGPDAAGVVPGEQLVVAHHAAAGERLARLGRPARVARALAHTSASRPHATTSPRSSATARSRSDRALIEQAQARRGLARAHEQGRRLGRPRGALDEARRHRQERRVVAARARVRLQHPQRPERRLALARREARRACASPPSCSSAPRMRRRAASSALRRALAGVVAVERARDGGRDRLDLVVAPLADQVVLDVPEARLVARRLLEDRPVPQQRARGVLPRGRVEDGEELARLAARARVLALGGGEQLLGQARDPSGAQLRPLAGDEAQAPVRGRRGLGAAQRAVLVARARARARARPRGRAASRASPSASAARCSRQMARSSGGSRARQRRS